MCLYRKLDILVILSGTLAVLVGAIYPPYLERTSTNNVALNNLQPTSYYMIQPYANRPPQSSKVINASNSNESQNDNLQQESKSMEFGEDNLQQESTSMEFVFYLPHTVAQGDKVTVRGEMSNNPTEFSIILATGIKLNDYSLRLAYHIDLIQDKTYLTVIQNDKPVVQEYLNPISKDDETWNLAITVRDDRVILEVDGSTHIVHNLEHPLSDIRVMHVTGKVKSVTALLFEFGRNNMAEENL